MNKNELIEIIKSKLLNKDLTFKTNVLDTYLKKYSSYQSATQKLIAKIFGKLKDDIKKYKDISKVEEYERMVKHFNNVIDNKLMGQYMSRVYLAITKWLKTNWKRLDSGKEAVKVVNEIAKATRANTTASFMSTTTLFCAFWNKDVYAIYDARVLEMIKAFKAIFKGTEFEVKYHVSTNKEKEYEEYYEALLELNKLFGNKYSFKDMDVILYHYHASVDPEENKKK